MSIVQWAISAMVAGTVSGAVILAAMLLLAGKLATRVPGMITGAYRRSKTTEIELRDNIASWVLRWFAERVPPSRVGMLEAFCRDDDTNAGVIETDPARRDYRDVDLRAGLGVYRIEYAGTKMTLDVREVTEGFNVVRHYTLIVPHRDREIISEFLKDAQLAWLATKDRRSRVLISDGEYWERLEYAAPRPWESVVLSGAAMGLLDDARAFFDNRKKYLDLGVPWRRGYLLSGPPGNGKTSMVQALAWELGHSIAVVSLSDNKTSDTTLRQAIRNLPNRSILLLEDVDAAFDHRVADESNSKITFSGLLNILDGIGSSDGQIVIMTTNHPEKLDPALIRPGRADVHVELDNATDLQAMTMMCRFNPSVSSADLADFGDACAGKSMAEIQSMLIDHWGYPHDAARVAKLKAGA